MRRTLYKESWDLSTIPDAPLKSEWARRNNAKRITRSGGPKQKDDPATEKHRKQVREAQTRLRAIKKTEKEKA